MAALLVLVLLLRGDASAGDLVAYITAAGMLPKPIRQLSEVSATIQKGLAGAESIFAQLDEAPEPDHGTVERERVEPVICRSASSPSPIPGSAQRVLDKVSFSVEPGQMVALVGRSGSGKSTLANLIPRFYHHDSGQILIDGVDVEDYTLRNLRQAHRAGHPAGRPLQRHGGQQHRLRRSGPAPRAAVEAAAEAAFAREFIDRLPMPASTRWSAKTASCCRAASGSAWRLPARCSRTRRS
jgi:subfamily B ATP-binding cassette protein MsbA